MRIILLGPPGSGKGTQGELIEKAYGIERFSTGDLLREAVDKGTDLGRRIQKPMERGELVSDDIVIELIQEKINKKDSQAGYILDGFPRNIQQARELEKIDPGKDEIALDIRISDHEVIERLSGRRVCSGCGAVFNLKKNHPEHQDACDKCGGTLIQREDDRPEVKKKRLEVYHARSENLTGYYKSKSTYREVDGSGGIKKVFARIAAVLNQHLSKKEVI